MGEPEKWLPVGILLLVLPLLTLVRPIDCTTPAPGEEYHGIERPQLSQNTKDALNLASIYCKLFGLRRYTRNPVLTERYISCRSGIFGYFKLSVDQNLRDDGVTITNFGMQCIIVQVDETECSGVMNHFSALLYSMSDAAELLTALKNNRYFIAEGNYREINLVHTLWREYNNREYPDLDIHLSYNEFGIQDIAESTIAIKHYTEHLNAENKAVMNQLRNNRSRGCNSTEAIFLYRIFVVGYGFTRYELANIFKFVCTYEGQKLFNWSKPQLLKILSAVLTYRYSIKPAVTAKFLRNGWRFAFTQWGVYDDDDWDFIYISELLRFEDDAEYFSVTETLTTAYDNGFTQHEFRLLSLDTDRRVSGYNPGTCMSSIFKEFFYLRENDTQALDYGKMNYWRGKEKQPLIDYLVAVTRFAHRELIKCRDVIPHISTSIKIMFQRNWGLESLTRMIRKSIRRNKTFLKYSSCLSLTANIEGLIMGGDPKQQSEYEQSSLDPEDIFSTLLQTSVSSCDEMSEHVVTKGAVWFYQLVSDVFNRNALPSSINEFMTTIIVPKPDEGE